MICFDLIDRLRDQPRTWPGINGLAAFLDALNGGELGAWSSTLPQVVIEPLRFGVEDLWRIGFIDRRITTTATYEQLLALVPECYRAAILASAREMMLERDQVRELLGYRPLSAWEKSYLRQWDAGLSLILFLQQDYAEWRAQLPPSKIPLLGPDDPQPYTPEEIDVASTLRAQRIIARREQIAAQIAAGQAGGYSDILQDQLANQLSIDYLFPIIGPDNRDFAAETDPERKRQLALRQARDIDLQALAIETRTLQTAAQARAYWEGNYPLVELRAEDNPHIDPALLARPWWSNALPAQALWSPPTVKLLVTPREKPIPDLGFLGGIGGTILANLAQLIPVIGNVASYAISEGQKDEQKSWKSAVLNGIPQSVFAPQYFPKPFFIALPLDEAQAAVKSPSFVPALAWRFRDQTKGLANPFQ